MSGASVAAPAATEIRLTAHPSQLSEARSFAEAAAEAFGFDSEESYAFKFAASEAVANAIEHGEPCDEGTVHMRVVAEDSRLTLYVSDCGTFVAKGDTIDEDDARGRGLMFMELLVDEVEVTSTPGSTTVRLTKSRSE